jgi:hypothetical protein
LTQYKKDNKKDNKKLQYQSHHILNKSFDDINNYKGYYEILLNEVKEKYDHPIIQSMTGPYDDY